MFTAFSRHPHAPKHYVQDLIKEHGLRLCQLLLHEIAHVYVCGDARNMARGVYASFQDILDGCGEVLGCANNAEEYLGGLKQRRRWMEDVW
jgi:cytochrome P450/NADPH-cytochrome P450 reductase